MKGSLNAVFLYNYKGASQEVGRSCTILEFKGRGIRISIIVFGLYYNIKVKLCAAARI